MKKRLHWSGALYLAGGLFLSVQAQQMPVAELRAGLFRIEAEVAHTPQARQQGLMNRNNMEAHHGMIFIFDQVDRHCMWMKNTPLPLSVAFMDEKGQILNIEDMQPHTEESHCAAAPARYALEMNQGWFKKRGLKAGDQIQGIARLPAAQ